MLSKYVIAILIGIIIGYRLLPPLFIAIIFLSLIATCGVYALQGKVEKVLITIPFVIYAEIFVRSYVRGGILPYLSVQYTLMIVFAILLFNSKNKKTTFHLPVIVVFILFYIVEIINGFISYKSIVTSAIQLNTLAVLIPALWASSYKISPELINKIIDSIRLATIFLAGIVLVAHLQGKIDYGGISNSEASNLMAPVQLSGYMGSGAVFFLISILNPLDKRSKIVQSITFALVVTLMVLTFSRGGIYFVAIITILYMIFNKTNFGNYFKFIIFIPIGVIIYNFVILETGGKIVERYEAKGASNREELVAIGLLIFTENPILGIGTGNYNTYIIKNKLFTVESGAHNEFIRVLAEHGIFGLFFYWGFFVSLIVVFLRRQKPANQYSIYFLTLFILITIHNGLKISIQPFLLMIAIALAPPVTNQIKLKNRTIDAKARLQPAQ